MNAGDLIASKYRLVRVLGNGAMGEVWAAVNDRTHREVALKLIPDPNPSLRERMLREARACGSLRHPNIVEIYDVGETAGGDPFLVMELLSGETLAERLTRKGPVPPAEAVAMVCAIARALRAAHAKGIIHRDLKPANVFLHREPDVDAEQIKVLDFGVSKNLVGDATSTTTGTLVGSPAYMSPEQARGEKHIDPRSDLWSLGIVLFEMIAGSRPFPNRSPYMVIAELLSSAPVPRLSEVVPGVSPGLSSVVDRCLTRDLAARVASANELLRLLLPFIDEPAASCAPLDEETKPGGPGVDLPTGVIEAPGAGLPRAYERDSEEFLPTNVLGDAHRHLLPGAPEPSGKPAGRALQVSHTLPLPADGTQPLPHLPAAQTAEDDQRATAPMAAPVAKAGKTPTPLARLPASAASAGATSTTTPLVRSPDPPAISAPSRRTVVLVATAAVVVLSLAGMGLVNSFGSTRAEADAARSAEPSAAPPAEEAPAPAPEAPAPGSIASATPSADGTGTAPSDPASQLRRGKTGLAFASNVPARVFVDGSPVGVTPLALVAAKPGTHRVTFKHTLLGERAFIVQVKAGEVTSVVANFTRWSPTTL
jgi:eukaryotic-like serine/threonine-protein kinase